MTSLVHPNFDGHAINNSVLDIDSTLMEFRFRAKVSSCKGDGNSYRNDKYSNYPASLGLEFNSINLSIDEVEENNMTSIVIKERKEKKEEY